MNTHTNKILAYFSEKSTGNIEAYYHNLSFVEKRELLFAAQDILDSKNIYPDVDMELLREVQLGLFDSYRDNGRYTKILNHLTPVFRSENGLTESDVELYFNLFDRVLSKDALEGRVIDVGNEFRNMLLRYGSHIKSKDMIDVAINKSRGIANGLSMSEVLDDLIKDGTEVSLMRFRNVVLNDANFDTSIQGVGKLLELLNLKRTLENQKNATKSIKVGTEILAQHLVSLTKDLTSFSSVEKVYTSALADEKDSKGRYINLIKFSKAVDLELGRLGAKVPVDDNLNFDIFKENYLRFSFNERVDGFVRVINDLDRLRGNDKFFAQKADGLRFNNI